jgi:hypothetical protein
LDRKEFNGNWWLDKCQFKWNGGSEDQLLKAVFEFAAIKVQEILNNS